MTLKEKFEQYAKEEVWEKKNYNAEECEVIADEFAIGFAEWLLIIYNEDIIYDAYTKEELLEIYKKESNL
jgi:hypothetical protein